MTGFVVSRTTTGGREAWLTARRTWIASPTSAKVFTTNLKAVSALDGAWSEYLEGLCQYRVWTTEEAGL